MSFLSFLSGLLRKTFAPHTYWLPYLGRRALTYWASWVPRRAQAPRKRLSAAQRCNDDVLEEIFLLLPRPALTSAARVCHDWLPSARRTLYRTLYFDAQSPSAKILAQTLRMNPVLRDLIRRLTMDFMVNRTSDLAMFDWLALLSEHSLQSITFESTTLGIPESTPILDYPAVRTATRIIARSPPTPPRLYALLTMSHLASLSVTIRAHFPPPNRISLPNLRRLSITLFQYTPTVNVILKGLTSPLDQFDIKITNGFEEEDFALLQAGLFAHAPHIQRLSLDGKPFSYLPFADDYIAAFTSLRTFFCSYPSYTPQIVSRIPSTIVSLTLCAPMDESIADEALAEALERNRHRLRALRRITIVDDRYRRQPCKALSEFCRLRGIGFATMDCEAVDNFYS